MSETVVGLKLLREDGGSLSDLHGRVLYPVGRWITVPGDGAFVALTGGLSSGGVGPVLAAMECEEPTGATSPSGVTCFRRVRRLAALPDRFRWAGDMDLSGLTSAEGLTLPESVGGRLYLSGLTSAEGLTLPESVGGGLDLSGLTSAEGLTLPESVGGWLYLSGLTSAEGLTLPESVGGWLSLSGLTSAERERVLASRRA